MTVCNAREEDDEEATAMENPPEDDWLLGVRPQPAPVTAEEYETLPQKIARAIEIVDGYVVHRQTPTFVQGFAGRLLAGLLERHARTAKDRRRGCFTVDREEDLRLRDVPLLIRRPDVVLRTCLHCERGGPRPGHALLVAEIVSPGSETQDTIGKPGEYASAGVPHYWVVRLGNSRFSTIERYRLDRASKRYKHVGTLMDDEPGDPPQLSDPIPITIDWDELRF